MRTIPDASSTITKEERLRYDHDGYLIRAGLFSRDECRAFTDHVMSETCAQMPKIGSQETDATRHPRIFNAHNQDPVQLRLFTDPRVCGVVESLIGLPIAGIQSMVMFKEPGMRGQAYHQDSHYIQNTPDTLTAIWIAMEPANTENGCLHVVPGSHCDGIQTDHPITNHEEHESWTSEVSVDRDRETPVVLNTGGRAFFSRAIAARFLPQPVSGQLPPQFCVPLRCPTDPRCAPRPP
jgi:phytanoyl-CoA hydroxylase